MAAKAWLSNPTSDCDQRKLMVLFFGFVLWESRGALMENSRLLAYGDMVKWKIQDWNNL